MNTEIQEVQLNTYPTYKDSGVEWLGKIPEHWEVKKFKHVMKINNGVDYKHIQVDEGYPVIGSGGQFAYASDYLYDGEVVLLGRKGTIDKPLYFNGKFWTVDTMFYAVAHKNNITKFLYYLSSIIPFKFYSTSTALPSMTQDDLNKHSVAIPPLSEQTAIANFLDDKCAKIDAAVEIKQQQIELLKERRQIAIHQAVTQGLDKNVRMKDSGVEWIGKIPEHWEVKALKYICFLKSGETIAPESFKEKGYPVYGGNGFRGYTSTYTNEGFTILIGRQGALCGNVNYANDKFYASEHAVVVYPLNKEEVLWLGETIRMANFNRLSQSAAQPGIAVNIIKNVLFPYPSLCEQKEISKYIKSINEKIDSAISIYEQEIEKLKEYKTILINSAVTGKIMVNC